MGFDTVMLYTYNSEGIGCCLGQILNTTRLFYSGTYLMLLNNLEQIVIYFRTSIFYCIEILALIMTMDSQ